MSPSFEGTSYSEGLRIAGQQLEDAQNRFREIFIVTDLQSVGLDLHNLTDIAIQPDTEIVIKDVADESSNLFIEQVRLQRQVFQETYPHSVVVRVSSSGSLSSATSGQLLLYLEDELIDRKGFALAEGGPHTVTVDFAPFPVPATSARGKIVLETTDELASDDNFFFVLQREDPFTIKLVADQAASTLYFENALSSGTNLPFSVRQGGRENDALVLVLNDLSRPVPSELKDAIQKNRGVIFALGSRIEPTVYNRDLDDYLPVQITERKFARSQGSSFVSITETSPEHPIFRPFRELQENPFSSIQFYGYWHLEPKEGSTVLARFNTGEPALVEGRIGDSRIMVFATSLDRVWSDFPLRNAYVPFWQQIVQYVGQWKLEPASMNVGEALSVIAWSDRLSPGQSRKWDLLDPQGMRLLGLDEDRPDFVHLQSPGYYELRRERKTDWIAVNTDRTESDISRLSKEELLSAFKNKLNGKEPQEVAASPLTSSNENGEALW
jgi:hypothetical protein